MKTDATVWPSELTMADFAALPEEAGQRLELSRGRLVREPAPGPRHSRVTLAVLELLRASGEARGLGLVFVDCAFALSTSPATVRVPDVAFVSAARIPGEGITDRFWELAPDLAVQVVSPSNRASDMQRKALEYLDAGARLVWIVDPEERTIAVYRSRADIRVLSAAEILRGEDVLPDLRVPVDELLTEIGRS